MRVGMRAVDFLVSSARDARALGFVREEVIDLPNRVILIVVRHEVLAFDEEIVDAIVHASRQEQRAAAHRFEDSRIERLADRRVHDDAGAIVKRRNLLERAALGKKIVGVVAGRDAFQQRLSRLPDRFGRADKRDLEIARAAAVAEEMRIDRVRRSVHALARMRHQLERMRKEQQHIIEQRKLRSTRGVTQNAGGVARRPLDATRHQPARLDVEEQICAATANHLVNLGVGRECARLQPVARRAVHCRVDHLNGVAQLHERATDLMAVVMIELGCVAQDNAHALSQKLGDRLNQPASTRRGALVVTGVT